MSLKIDLHTHSTISDGSYSPAEIIRLAAKNNVNVVALTDHDSIEGIAEAQKIADNLGIVLLPGIEFTVSYEVGRRLHILGLGIDITNDTFRDAYTNINKSKDKNIIRILKLLGEKGVSINIESLREDATKEYMDRYDIYRYMLKNSICENAREVWDKYLDLIPFGEDELITAGEAIKIIKKAGGLSFLAHYNKEVGLKGCSRFELETHLKKLISLGLDGIERYYPSYTPKDVIELEYLIHKYHLMASGGTDYHGASRPDIKLGIGCNNTIIPYSIYENILAKLNKI